MANPPITIGPFSNVPAPGSPIASAWAQQITHFVDDRWPTSLLIRHGTVTVPTNANGDALVTFPTAFPNSLVAAVVSDASQSFDIAFILKVMWTSSSKTTLVVRFYTDTGAKVTNNGGVSLSYIAYGR